MLRVTLLSLLVVGANPSQAPEASKVLRVAAASDLRFALDDLLASFQAANPGVRVEATYGSSGNFFAQIREGAPFDVFLSADSEYARRLTEEGLAEAPFPYATGRLALVVRRASGLDPSGLGALLRSPAVKKLAIANPAHAPYGRAAEAALATWKIRDLVSSKLVFGDSVAQALHFVDAGAAEAGLVALSLVKGGGAGFVYAEVPESAHPPLEQAGVVLKKSPSLDAARAFEAHLRDETGRAILARYGFGLPRP